MTTNVLSSQSYTVGAQGCVDVTTVSPTDAGYVVVSFSSSASNVQIWVAYGFTCSSSGFDAPFGAVIPSGTSGTYDIPTSATASDTVMLLNTNTLGSATVTLTVVEYT